MSGQQEHIKRFNITRSKPSEIEIYFPFPLYSSLLHENDSGPYSWVWHHGDQEICLTSAVRRTFA